VSEQRRDVDGWPLDERGRRTDPIGRYLDSLTPEQRRAWGATCTENVPRLAWKNGRVRTIYPWERDDS
jgi:hypothetical protein